jgi:excisionase family DNA binding protein
MVTHKTNEINKINEINDGLASQVGHMPNGQYQSPLMTVEEVAEMLRCSVRFVYGLISKGKLRVMRAGEKMTRIHRSSVIRLIEEWSCGGMPS